MPHITQRNLQNKLMSGMGRSRKGGWAFLAPLAGAAAATLGSIAAPSLYRMGTNISNRIFGREEQAEGRRRRKRQHRGGNMLTRGPASGAGRRSSNRSLTRILMGNNHATHRRHKIGYRKQGGEILSGPLA